tara:strand:- start:55 stop:1053 length:999 start_codon:yes stop_codon:yes gene_type:complete
MIIAEIGQAHDGSLGIAHSYIDAVAKSGAHAIKFQTHVADAESSIYDKWRVKFSRQDDSRYDYWKRMEFSFKEWEGLRQHAKEVGLKFLSSAFSIKAFEILEKIDVDAWKIASGEISNFQLLDKMISTTKPVYLSTGMSTLSEIDNVIKTIQNAGNPICLFQCTSMYPTPSQKWGLNIVKFFKEKYQNCSIGFSDHSGDIYSSLAAITLGADIVEVHVVFDKNIFGPDTSSSITLNQLEKLVIGEKEIKNALENPVDKDSMAIELADTKTLFNKSVFTSIDVKKNEILTEKNCIFKKPGTGIPISKWKKIKGSKFKKDFKKGMMISIEDICS